jgi:predicted Zn finger-like uncharacterized protein
MNVICSLCGTVYRVDPGKVPEGGVQARCSSCSGVFRVEREAEEESAPDQATVIEERAQEALPEREPGDDVEDEDDDEGEPEPLPTLEARPLAGAPTATADRAPEPMTEPETQPVIQPVIQPETRGEPAPAAPERAPSPFGSSDPHARARRLARALVSDILVYHPERRERSRQAGTLRQEFREEIKKSWEEYVAQVGVEFARQTPYFRDALNEILAGGERVF